MTDYLSTALTCLFDRTAIIQFQDKFNRKFIHSLRTLVPTLGMRIPRLRICIPSLGTKISPNREYVFFLNSISCFLLVATFLFFRINWYFCIKQKRSETCIT